jgi:hypothetical protein
LSHASGHGTASPRDLAALARTRLVEDRQQDDPPVHPYPVADPDRLVVQVEPQLAEPAVELPGVRLAEQRTVIREQIEVERRSGELDGRKLLEPVPDLRLELLRYPRT